MKILIVSQYFWPENFKINDLCIELQKKGNEVVVLTGKPNYPSGKYYNGYKFWGFQSEYYENISIRRVPLFSRKNGNNFNLFLNYMSYVFFASIYVLFNKNKFDIIFCYAVSPITIAIPGILAKYLYKSKFYIWIQDLWPESTYVNNRIENSFFKFLLNRMVSFIYSKSDRIYIQSETMRIPIQKKMKKNKINNKIIFLPNWAEDFYYKKINNKYKYSSLIPDDKFTILFAGNIGSGIDVNSIIKTIEILKNHRNIKFIFIGDGSEKKYLQQSISEKKIDNNVIFIRRHQATEMPYFYKLADVLFTSFRSEKFYSYILPSKIPTYMASGKPILVMANGQASATIKEAKCGFTVPSGDFKSLAAKILILSEMDKENLKNLGVNGRNYSIKNFSKLKIVNKILEN